MSSVKCILTEQGGKGNGSSSSVVPIRLEITQNPAKLVYGEDDIFVIDGLQGTVFYGVQGSALQMGSAAIPNEIPLSSLTFSPTGPLKTDVTTITSALTEMSFSV